METRDSTTFIYNFQVEQLTGSKLNMPINWGSGLLLKDDSLILPRHLSLRDIYLWDILLWVLLLWGHTSIKLKKSKLLTGLTCVLIENHRYAEKKNLEVKQIFV
jgi:hypothetical protein